jgi:hypothetical protein
MYLLYGDCKEEKERGNVEPLLLSQLTGKWGEIIPKVDDSKKTGHPPIYSLYPFPFLLLLYETVYYFIVIFSSYFKKKT